MEIISATGVKLKYMRLTTRLSEINLSNMANGIYSVRILDVNGKAITTKRVALIK